MVQVLYGLHCANDTCAAVLLNDFRMDGKESLMVVADFDYTFTLRLGENGEPGCLTHEVFDLNKEVKGTGFTVGDLQRKMNANYETVLSNCTLDEERAYVQTGWWNASHDIIIRSMVHRDDIPGLVRSSRLIWRKNVQQFLLLLEELSIPLLIFSAGITNVIEEAIRQLLGHFPENITVAANTMYFGESGYVTSFTCPPVHTLNKTMAHLRDLIHGVDRMHSSRTNILVTGDSEVDAHMVDGWQQKRVLRVGLVEDERPMLNSFDIVIKGNSFNRLRDLVKYVASTQQL
ncbi:hypothetical protein Q1695_010123 [Nippostrongylus brasiliensis]|nr:hypothetical protein Q1695_010123 [Nippostrongylus brasiliensis]